MCGCLDTYQLLKDALIECFFWLPASVKFLVVLLETLEMGFPLLSAVIAQLFDAVRVGRWWSDSRTRWKKSERLSVSCYLNLRSDRQFRFADIESISAPAAIIRGIICCCSRHTYRSRAHLVTRRPSLRQWAGSRLSFLQSMKSSLTSLQCSPMKKLADFSGAEVTPSSSMCGWLDGMGAGSM